MANGSPELRLVRGKGHCHHGHERGLCLHRPVWQCQALLGCVGPLPSFTPGEDVQSLDSHRLELVEKLNQATVPGCPRVPRSWQVDAKQVQDFFHKLQDSPLRVTGESQRSQPVILCSSRWAQSSQPRKSATAPSCKKCGEQRTRRARLDYATFCKTAQ